MKSSVPTAALLRKWLRLALICFAIAGIAGAVLRLIFVTEIPGADFRNVLHGHSHLAMFGWLYPVLFALLTRSFPEVAEGRENQLDRLYIASVAVALAIFIIMVFQGYSRLAIILLTFHIVLTYIFSFWFLKRVADRTANSASLFAKASIIFMIISTFALWAIGPIMASGKAGSALYYATIQFFLHFQLNGWYIFAALSILLHVLAEKGIVLKDGTLKAFFWLLVVSTCLTYVLAVTWSTPLPVLFVINSVGVVVQLLALMVFARIIIPRLNEARDIFSGAEVKLYGIAMVCFGMKILAQSALVIPYIATVAYTIRNFVIGFIHLIVLGMITHMVLSISLSNKLLQLNRMTIAGLVLLFAGFILTESLLFGQGLMFWGTLGFLPHYYLLLFLASVLVPLGVVCIIPGVNSAAKRD